MIRNVKKLIKSSWLTKEIRTSWFQWTLCLSSIKKSSRKLRMPFSIITWMTLRTKLITWAFLISMIQQHETSHSIPYRQDLSLRRSSKNLILNLMILRHSRSSRRESYNRSRATLLLHVTITRILPTWWRNLNPTLKVSYDSNRDSLKSVKINQYQTYLKPSWYLRKLSI